MLKKLQVITQDNAGQLTAASLQDLNGLKWQCPHCSNEVQPFEHLGQWYKAPSCNCIASYLAGEKKAINSNDRLDMIIQAGFNFTDRTTKRLQDFKPTAATLKNGKDALKQVEVFRDYALGGKHGLLHIHGAYGVGKSHLASGLAMSLIYRLPAKGFTCNMIKAGDDLKSVSGEERSEMFGHYLHGMRTAKVLLIDDLDKVELTTEPLKLLYDVFEYRNGRMDKITISTANSDLGNMVAGWSQGGSDKLDKVAAIARRLKDMLVSQVGIIGSSYEVKNG